MNRPNILLIVADDLSPRHVSAYGPPGIPTPALGRIARTGAIFHNAWASLTCIPTRVTMMTGWYGPRLGYITTPPHRAPPDTFQSAGTFAHILRGLGYTTAVVGKWQHTTSPEECGFDHHFIWPRYLNVKRRWPRYWRPYLVENGRRVATGPDDFGPDLCATWTMRFLDSHRPAIVLHNELLLHTEGNRRLGPGERIIPVPGLPLNREGRLEASIRYWDGIVDRMTSEPRPDTVYLITSDNATEGLGKGSLDRDQGAKVILLAMGVDVVAGERQQLVDVSDWYPTLIELAGGRSLVHDGESFAPTLREPQRAGREWIYSWLRDADLVRTHDWLLDGQGALWLWRNGRWTDPAGDSRAALLKRAHLAKIVAEIRGRA